MASFTSSSFYRYDGSVASLDSGLLSVSLLNGGTSVGSATLTDQNGFLSASDDTGATFRLGGATGAVEFIGTGTISTLGVLGIKLDPRPVAVFSVDGQIYFYAPNGLPLLSGLSVSFDINRSGTLTFPTVPDGKVDGLETGEVMTLGYADKQGDQITVGNDVIYAYEGNDTVNANAGSDTIFGGAGNDALAGDAGADSLFGGDGADNLSGGDDNDVLTGGAGNDTLAGGAGFDTADYSASTGGVVIDLQGGSASGGDAAGDVLSGIEGLVGTGQDDRLLGDDAMGNALWGGAGNDSLDGRGGNDSLYGGSGSDTLLGGLGADVLDGGIGDDVIVGGGGADTISGGAGNDILSELGIGVVVDGGENSGDNDTIDLSNWGWKQTRINYAPGNSESGTVDFLDLAGNVLGSMQFSNIEKMIPCFTPGTMITSRRGEVAVEELRAGDEVLTRDGGFRRLVWTGKRVLSAADLVAEPALRPVRIAAGALGDGLPERDMRVSPQHRMLIEGHRAEMLFGEGEVLVAAKHLTGLDGVDHVRTDGVTYIHIMFDRHEIVCADGAWSESFQPSARMVRGMERAQAEEILALFPELAAREVAFPAARLSLKAHEVRVLMTA